MCQKTQICHVSKGSDHVLSTSCYNPHKRFLHASENVFKNSGGPITLSSNYMGPSLIYTPQEKFLNLNFMTQEKHFVGSVLGLKKTLFPTPVWCSLLHGTISNMLIWLLNKNAAWRWKWAPPVTAITPIQPVYTQSRLTTPYIKGHRRKI